MPLANATLTERRMMLRASRHERISGAARASTSCAAAVTSEPTAQAATSVATVGSSTSAAMTVVRNGSAAIAMSVTLTVRTSPRAWAIDIS